MSDHGLCRHPIKWICRYASTHPILQGRECKTTAVSKSKNDKTPMSSRLSAELKQREGTFRSDPMRRNF